MDSVSFISTINTVKTGNKVLMKTTITQCRSPARRAPESQRGEQRVDLCGADPGARAPETPGEVGGALRVEALLPRPLDHPLQLGHAGHFPH